MTTFPKTFALATFVASAMVPIAATASVVNSTFLGGDRLYSNAANWSPAEVPNNTATKQYNVTALEEFFLDRDSVTISNLTIGDWALSSMSPWLTVIGATTVNRTPGSNITGVVNLVATTAPITFALGSLSTFNNGVLTGGYGLIGPSTLQFNGANVTVLSGASVSLGSASRIRDENGIDGLRNLARIDADSSLTMNGRQFATAGNLTVDGTLSVLAQNTPGVFRVTGLLTNFDYASRTLQSGTYELNGYSSSATFQFSGAGIVNNAATLSLSDAATIVDETGRDALRNFSHNLATGEFSVFNRDTTIGGNFTNDGLLDVRYCSMTVLGSLTNFDRASKTLNGGTYRMIGGAIRASRFSFTGADIVRNNASLFVNGAASGSATASITDELGNDALRNLIENQANGIIEMHAPFTSASDFTNAGKMVLGSSFTIATGHLYRQVAGSTFLNTTKFIGNIDVSAGELTSRAAPPSVRPPAPFPGATPTITGNLTVGAAVLKPKQLGVDGNAQLSSKSTLHYVADVADSVKAGLNVSGTLTLGGELRVEFPSPFPAASLARYYIATAGTLTGGFSNAAVGSRIMTADGAGSFLLSFTSQNGLLLTDYQRAVPAAQLLNISTRAQVLTGGDVPIGGFIVYGHDPKEVIVRAIGPSLSTAGVGAALRDPTLELHDATGVVIAANDNWRDSQAAEITSTGLAPRDARESAIVATLQPGTYTAVLRGANDTTGVALVELYDLSKDARSKLANISTRGFVDADNMLIGGLIAGGNGTGKAELVVRALGGFSLEERGVANPLADPALELRNGNGTLLAANDDFFVPPENHATVPRELHVRYTEQAATGIQVSPGAYTVVVYGKGGASGNALVEIYDLNR